MSVVFILLENSGCLSSLVGPVCIEGRSTLLAAFFSLLPKATAEGDNVPLTLTFMLWHSAPSRCGGVYYGEHMDVQGGKSAGLKPSIKWDWKRFLHGFWKFYTLFPLLLAHEKQPPRGVPKMPCGLRACPCRWSGLGVYCRQLSPVPHRETLLHGLWCRTCMLCSSQHSEPGSISLPVPTAIIVNSGGGLQASYGWVVFERVCEKIWHFACPERCKE